MTQINRNNPLYQLAYADLAEQPAWVDLCDFIERIGKILKKITLTAFQYVVIAVILGIIGIGLPLVIYVWWQILTVSPVPVIHDPYAHATTMTDLAKFLTGCLVLTAVGLIPFVAYGVWHGIRHYWSVSQARELFMTYMESKKEKFCLKLEVV